MPNNKTNVNPFEVAQNRQNPFSQPINPWGPSRAPEQSLPTLSDFLKKDDCRMTDEYLNRRGFGSRPTPNTANLKSFDEEKQGSKITAPRIEFEPSSKLLPLMVAAKPKQQPSQSQAFAAVEAETNEKETIEESSWFTRDRGGAFEEEEDYSEETPYNEEPYKEYTPAVIDYGHGSTAQDKFQEDDEYDIPRCERVATQGQDESYNYIDDDDDTLKDAVTIDYGHGSVPTKVPVALVPVPAPYGRRPNNGM